MATLSKKKRLEKVLPLLFTRGDRSPLELLPVEAIEQALGRALRWRVLTSREEVREADLGSYNTVCYVDVHRRLLHLPPDHRHPLAKYGPVANWLHSPSLAEELGAHHNQILISGDADGAAESPIELHIGAVFDDSLFLNDLVLMNPWAEWGNRRPLGPDHWAPGIGNGICAEVLRRLSEFARTRGLRSMRGYAVDNARAQVFANYGFSLDESDPFLLRGAAETGQQIPIWKSLE